MKKKKSKKNLSELKVDYVETSPGRYSVVDTETGEIVDDANGYGYKTKGNAIRAWKYKIYEPTPEVKKFKDIINNWWKEHKGCEEFIDQMNFETTCKDREDFTEKDAIMYTKNWIEYEKAEKPEGIHTWQLVHYYFRFK